ncbi:MAG TPA: FAD-binding protein, partial [Terriglobales bacterium]|nr:FAD-binding protein [Terriglobales bacterium]
TLAAAARERLSVVPWGGGVALPRARPPERYDIALDLSALDRIVEYQPEDLTLVAECGAALAALSAALAEHGQELPLEGALAARATLGGVLAANASGPRRLRFGAPRDRILGARFALGDGTTGTAARSAVVRSGGRVVKNVAGYAVHRLLCGSRGGLAVLLEAALKLVPAPGRRVALIYGIGPRELRDEARWASLPRLEPAVLSVVGDALTRELSVASPTGPFTLVAGFEDDEARVEEQTAACERALGEPDARLVDEPAARLWQGLADLERRGGARLTLATSANTPAALAPLLAHPTAAATSLLHAPAGRLVDFPGEAPAREVIAPLLETGFTLLEALAGTGDLAGVAALEPPIRPQAAELALRERLREAFDPAGVFAFGERWARGEGL